MITERTVATLAWMFAGNEPPTPAASARTLAAAASVALYQGSRAAGAAAGDDPGRLVAFVLQGLHQDGDLLPEAGELRHAAE